jgi:hypothetical protein
MFHSLAKIKRFAASAESAYRLARLAVFFRAHVMQGAPGIARASEIMV